MFKVVDGTVEAVESIFGKMKMNRDGQMEMFTDEAIDVPQAEPQVVKTERALNPKGYKATIKIRYDENFKAQFGADSVNTIRRIMAQAQNIWRWPSLTTSVTFLIDSNIEAVADKFYARSDIDKAGNYSTANGNVNVMMAFRNNQPGTVGISFVGTACYPPNYEKYRTALCEYTNNDLSAAETVAHEIGHSMNMGHDFIGRVGNVRKDSMGNTCSGILNKNVQHFNYFSLK